MRKLFFPVAIFAAGLAAFFLFAAQKGPQDKKVETPAQKRRNYRLELADYKSMLKGEYPDKSTIKFNIAHCYLALDSLHQAVAQYLSIAPELNARRQSVAYNNLGVIETKLKNLKVARRYFMLALIANSANADAKYNLELLLKRLRERQEEEPPPPEEIEIEDLPLVSNPQTPRPIESSGDEWVYAPMTGAQLEAELRQQIEQEKQYIQELKKSLRTDKKYSSDPQY